VEGCGKTSQIQLTCGWLQSNGISVIVTREPGGTELGLHLRRLLLEKAEDKPIAQTTELLLYAADRSQHVEQELKPNLAAGKYILCDRYTDSTVAYQGYGRGLNIGLINQLNYIATAGLESDLTIWLDVDVEVGLARKRKDEAEFDRIEQEAIAFHRRVQQGYVELAASYPSRIIRVDGNLSQEAVQQKIQEILGKRLIFP
jgi:dTMP kinase